MAGGVPGSPDLPEELRDLGGQDALVLKPPNQIVLGLARRLIFADIGRDVLREQLGELSQLEERGVGVIREIAFRQHAETQELLVMRFELGEIGPENP
jgi:hypothetical protein